MDHAEVSRKLEALDFGEMFGAIPLPSRVLSLAQGYDISFAVTEDHDVLSWGAKGTGATGHRLGTGTFDDEDEDLYKEPRPIRDLVGEEVCQVQ